MLRIQEMCGQDAVLMREMPPGSGNYFVDNGTTLTPFSATQKATTSYNDTAGHIALSSTVGTALLTKATAGIDYTLALPTPGAFPAGQDGIELTILSTTAAAHVVTTTALGINGANHIMTFAAAIGNGVTLKAVNGTWLVRSNIGVTIT